MNKIRKILEIATGSIYFDDSSDYKTDLFSIVKIIRDNVETYEDVCEIFRNEFAKEEKKMDEKTKKIIKDVACYKKKLINEYHKKGLTENFGEKEQRLLREKYPVYGLTPEQYKIIESFIDWCYNSDVQNEE